MKSQSVTFFIFILSIVTFSCADDKVKQQNSTSVEAPSTSTTTVDKSDTKKQINDLYKKILGRKADPAGLRSGINLVNKKRMNLRQLELSLATSKEFHSRFIKGKEPKVAAQKIFNQLNPSATNAKINDLIRKLTEDEKKWKEYIIEIMKENR